MAKPNENTFQRDESRIGIRVDGIPTDIVIQPAVYMDDAFFAMTECAGKAKDVPDILRIVRNTYPDRHIELDGAA